MNKKGELGINTLGGLAIGVAVLGICLVVSFLVLGSTTTKLSETGSETWSSADNVTPTTVTTDYVVVGSLVVKNDSTTLGSGNYTTTSDSDGYLDTIVLKSGKPGVYVGKDLAMTFSTESLAYQGNKKMTIATAGIPGWVGIFIVAVVGAVLLGITRLYKQ